MTNYKKKAKKLMSVFLIFVIILTMLPITAFAQTKSISAVLTLADPDTSLTYEDDNFLGHEYSTEFAGRIWTDKSVNTIEGSNDFLVKFSALATSKTVTGQTTAPLDVVFVVDISGSMVNSDSGMPEDKDDNNSRDNKSRMYYTVKAVNSSIEKIMAMNPYTRVGLVVFSTYAQTLLPLGRYTKQGSYNYLTLGSDYPDDENYEPFTTMTVRAQEINTFTIDVQGGTNIQQGIATGASLFTAQNNSTTVEIGGQAVKRVPAMILLSDGAPTYSSSSRSWWSPTTSQNNYYGDGQNAYYGNGMKAMMTAAYAKQAINNKYGVTNPESDYAVQIHTIGMGISQLTGSAKNLADVTLNPVEYYNATNTISSNIRSKWNEYIRANNNSISVKVSNNGTQNHTLYHPSSNDIKDAGISSWVDQYHSADQADSVASVFDKIVSTVAINAPEVPTEVKENQSFEAGGYLTYTDPIGDYMELKGSSMTFHYEGVDYNVSDTDGDGTFTFDGNPTVKGSDDKDYSLNNIIIKLTEDESGKQTLTVQIPAILIPLRVNSITLNAQQQITSHTHNNELPCELGYKVGLIPDVFDEEAGHIRLIPMNSDGSAWSGDKLAAYVEYMKDNINEEDGTVSFYSNLFTGEEKILNNKTGLEHTVGDATATFEPSHTNPFYYIQEKMPIFADEAMTTPATADTIDDNTTYYHKEVFYHEDDIETKAVARTGKQLKKVEIEKDENGQWYRVPGSVRLNKLQLFENQKNPNTTNTAEDFYASHYNETIPTLEHFVVHLGNNGVLRAKVTGNLEITKTVTADDGLEAPDKTFNFKVDFTNVNADDELSYKIVDASGATLSTGLLKTGGTVALKHGQTVIIANIPDGVGYTVTEQEANQGGFVTTYTNKTGAIVAGEISKVEVINRYTATPVVVNGDSTDLDFVVKKNFTGRAWTANDSFTFILESNRLSTPMPQGSTPFPSAEAPTHYLKEVTVYNGNAVDFGSIEYTKPGTYVYTISERIPTPSISGVSYSGAMYQVTVVVTDNGEGVLSKQVTIAQIRNDEGTADNLATIEDNTIVFTNHFDAKDVEWIPVGTKDYKDNYGTNTLTNGMFSFKMTVNENSPANTPMPESAGDKGYTIDENIGPQIGFDAIHFTEEHVSADATKENPTVYYYDFTEVIPEGAIEIAEDVWSLDGMVYDGRTKTVQVNVYYEAVSGGEVEIVVEPIYTTVVGGISYNRLVFFNEYTPDPVSATIGGEKTLTGRDWKNNDRFEFVLSTNDNTTKTAISEGKITGFNTSDMTKLVSDSVTKSDKTFDFGELTFKATGTYKFQITETKGSLGGVEYDTHTTDVTVAVEPDPDNKGSMMTTVTYDNKGVAADTDKAVFINTYDAADSDAISVEATKVLTGRDMNEAEFFINVSALTENAPLGNSKPGNAVPAADDTNGKASATITVLNNIIFTEAGVFEYLVFEHIPSQEQMLGGITYDENTAYKVVVTVTDNTEGKLEAEYKIYKSTDKGATFNTTPVNAIIFNNSYKAKDAVSAPILLWKVLENKELMAGDFTFKLESVVNDGGMKLPQDTEVTNNADGEIAFGELSFIKEGIYRIKVYEVIPTTRKAGITYSDNQFVVEYIVTDNKNGQLEVGYRVVEGEHVFTNVYRPADGSAVISGTKLYTGGKTLADGDFEVGLYDSQGVEIDKATIKPGLNGAPGTFVFDEIIFTADDIGIHTYTVKEIIPDGATDNGNGTKTKDNIIYDVSEYKVEIIVSDDDKDGALNIEQKITLNDLAAELQFKNIFVPSAIPFGLTATKDYENRELEGNDFTFELRSADDKTNVLQTKKNDAEGKITFDNVSFKEAGDYKFTVKEIDKIFGFIEYSIAEYTVTVTVVNEEGVLRVSNVTSENISGTNESELTFVNRYKFDGEGDVVLGGTKLLTGDRTTVNEGEFEFGLYDEEGKLIESVKNDAQGKFQFTALQFDETHTTISGTNDYTYTVKEIVGSITGMTYDEAVYTVVVTVKDNDEGGVDVSYIVEDVPDGQIIFTNAYDAPDTEEPETPESPEIPQTGDYSDLSLWFALMFVSGGIVTTFIIHNRKRRLTENK